MLKFVHNINSNVSSSAKYLKVFKRKIYYLTTNRMGQQGVFSKLLTIISFKIFIERLKNHFVLQVDNPTGLKTVKHLSGVFRGTHYGIVRVNFRYLIAVLLCELKFMFGDSGRVGQVASIFGGRVELDSVLSGMQPSGYWLAGKEPAKRNYFIA